MKIIFNSQEEKNDWIELAREVMILQLNALCSTLSTIDESPTGKLMNSFYAALKSGEVSSSYTVNYH
jgi:hypothetical protein